MLLHRDRSWRIDLPAATAVPLEFQDKASSTSGAAFSPDGRLVLCWEGENAAVLQTDNGRRRVGLRHPGGIWSGAISPDGQLALTGGTDRYARLHDTTTGEPVGVALAHGSTVSSVAFSPDGRLMLTGCSDQNARLWETASGRLIGPAVRHAGSAQTIAEFLDAGRMAWSWSSQDHARWTVPEPLSGSPVRLAAWCEVVTGVRLEPDGGLRPLDAEGWEQSRRRLEELGGPPP